MKSLLVIFLLIFSTVDVSAFQVFGGGAASTLDGQPGSYYLDLANHTGDVPASSFNNISAATVTATGDIIAGGFIDGKNSFGSLVDDNTGLGVVYDLNTSFQTYTSFDVSNVSSDITVSTSNGTITLGAGSGGEYSVEVDIAVTAVGGPELEFGVFLNLTSEIASFTREIRGVHHHPPIFGVISGGATFTGFSTVDALAVADGNVIQINEVNETPGFLYDLTFNNEVLYPTEIEFINTLYDGNNSGDLVEVRMWNYSTVTWVETRAVTGDLPDGKGSDEYRYYLREFSVPEPISSYVDIATKESKARVIHTTSGNNVHDLYLDKVQLHDSHNSAAISFSRILTVPGGSVLSIKIKSDLVLPTYLANMHFHVTKVSN